MSDANQSRFVLGNSGREHAQWRRPLVEECEIIWVCAVQQALGKKALLDSIRQAEPLRLRIPGSGYVYASVTYELHRLPGRRERWSSLEDGTARLWLVCPHCRRHCAKLYIASPFCEPRCRHCGRITYLSVNSGGNHWYTQVAVPLKRLLRERAGLLRRRGQRAQTKLRQLDEQIVRLRQQLRPKSKPQQDSASDLRRRQRRRYRDITLVE